MKLAGNFMIAAAIASMGQAAALAEGNGVPAAEMLNVLTKTVFSAPVYTNYSAIIAAKAYDPPGFKLTLGLKDIRLALAAGEAVHAPLPIASVLRDDFLECHRARAVRPGLVIRCRGRTAPGGAGLMIDCTRAAAERPQSSAGRDNGDRRRPPSAIAHYVV